MDIEKRNLSAIDIGTNSFHLVNTEVNLSSGRFRVLGKDKEIVRLGSGSSDMKYISEAAMNRGIMTLKRFLKIADSYKSEVRAVATSAVREALNRDEFIRRVRTETGLKIEIASGIEEARLIHLGVLQALPVFNKKILLVDIGGGSTEFLVGKKRDILFSNSLKLGAVRLTERFFKSESLNKKSVEECRRFVRGNLAPVIRDLAGKKIELSIGSSGTIAALANIIRTNRGEDVDAPVNNVIFTREELFDTIKLILKSPTSNKRAEIKGMDPLRADIIVAGAIILEQIFIGLNIEKMTVSEYALREGVILDSIEKLHLKGEVDHLHDIRYSSVIHLASGFHYEKNHAHHVALLALQLFDQTKTLHTLGGNEREYLEAAAILHDIGFYVSHAQHHRHSYYLIRNSELLGFTEEEKEIIANVARYHRKSHPKLKHQDFALLRDEERKIVIQLSAFLRIADGFDRSHASLVTGLMVTVQNRSVLIKALKNDGADMELELWGAERKKALFEEAFRRNVIFLSA